MQKECIPILLPTNKPIEWKVGDIVKDRQGLYVSKHNVFNASIKKGIQEPQHLYICSPTDEIKEGDWIYNPLRGDWDIITQADKKFLRGSGEHGAMKIIATTDSSLNLNSMLEANISGFKATNLWLIPQSFIQLYIERYNVGTPITKCMVEYETKLTSEDGGISLTTNFKEKISEGLGRQLNKHSFSGKYTPKLNGNEIIISECKEKLYTKAEMQILAESIFQYWTPFGQQGMSVEQKEWLKQNI